ncbi:diaminopimelate decarboxylase [Bacillus spizizenii]|uniref:Diaminopimelate decarboxylase n=1 Tax=Bacillus spizizenii (strain DSM 15029 / JCM 12233 / NBRC 101239 / NRRL B-23049 / TU-B-10) TaxID=1052585 RepID=G4NW36_BACS4|nr:diaminopimelate decarboxylase [Bacillus spizizenii]AEP87188.1 diaminopimelate decarboxylase [Bacillus spizizenii TU-B-10]KXJ35383.1 diaminopimelate decarboxylase [Bacillus spizizenii]MCI4167986.1 diaminopimelate decarboxylase [Bacillus spizizenii]MCY7867119.1 diaminopimelate decarboxylase [Bacillus spizizenii]MEC1435474.1 diaminopimelate decarboxylase [Bacillus spizizenii]
MFLHGTSRQNQHGHLEIGGVDALYLAEKYGTPLYVYDVALIRERAKSFKQAFITAGLKAQVAYASKAFSSVAMIQLAEEEGLSLDVVSGGELYTAVAAGFPAERIHFHGNNKSREELRMALEHRIGCIVVDNFYEISLLEDLCEETGHSIDVLLRITPGVEAHTHDYITTGQEDSKFGFDLHNGQTERAIEQVLQSEHIQLLGVHCHIGSQIFDTAGFVLAAEKIFKKLDEWRESYTFVSKVLNLGGGFGIRYTEDDEPLHATEYVEKIIEAVKENAARYGFNIPEIWIEPGRSLVGDAGTTLYTVGSQKEVPGVRQYVAVDGGMNDNIRPALYQAKYEAATANRIGEAHDKTVSIAGKCCESGDMLIWDIDLPEVKEGDLLAVFCTGAYGYSMANNYNRIPRPAVVFVENGEDHLVVKRETYEDIVKLDLPFKTSVKQ